MTKVVLPYIFMRQDFFAVKNFAIAIFRLNYARPCWLK